MNSNSLNEYLLCFIHIPKTAGSSFTDILIKLVGQDRFRVLLPDVIHGIKNLDFDINSYNGISGHFPYEISKLILKPALLLTFLRNPLSRSLSQFKQMQRMDLDDPVVRNSEKYPFFRQIRHMSFTDFIDHPFFYTEAANLQTRMLGLFIGHSIQHLSEVMPIDKSDDRWFSLELAKERLEQFAFIGLQEKFQESMDIFAYKFGTHPVANPPTINISSDKSDLSMLSESVVGRLEELNKLDIDLYEFGQKLFMKRYDEMQAALRKECLQSSQMSLYEILSLEFYKGRVITRFPYRYDFEETYQRAGWYPVERVNGQVWSWSGPETISSIDLPINRSVNLQIKFQVRHFISPDITKSLELHVDNQRVHLIHIVKEGIHDFIGIIPANTGKMQTPTTISFHVNRTAYPPGVTAETPGARLLGFALSWIEISPLGE